MPAVNALPRPAHSSELINTIDAALPQTQCTRCGYPDCRSYAQAIAAGTAAINQCPPGGAAGIARLAQITGQASLPLNPQNGTEGPRLLAVIDEAWCIGCTLCIKACPVDAIVGAAKQMHSVITDQCTGCELCIAPCPVDCISLVDTSSPPSGNPLTGWAAWSAQQADTAKTRYAFHQLRIEREQLENNARLAAKAQAKLADIAAASKLTDPEALNSKRAIIEAALARAKAQRKPA